MSNTHLEYFFKIIIIGDSSVGKSNILTRYTKDAFYGQNRSTIGVDFHMKPIIEDDKHIKLQIWDTAGQEKFRTIVQSYYRRTHGVILVFDLTNPESLKNVDHWMDEVYKMADTKIIILIGNKADDTVNIKVTQEQINEMAEKYNLPYFEVSAKLNTNINNAFMKLTALLLENCKEEPKLVIKVKPTQDKFPPIKRVPNSCC